MTLVVLRCRDLEASRNFYQALGLVFRSERHGAGPLHWSCSIGGFVLELYPAGKHTSAIDRLGFQVSDIEAATRAVELAGGTVEKVSADRALVTDPNGVRVELHA